ncbi:MAG TPA: hypothetical protein VGW78_02440 [Candidatus Babeliales bacterium]|jgi:hypothetical protein|nr:hypothetical protein [Candidatus Babeliales bacterium]
MQFKKYIIFNVSLLIASHSLVGMVDNFRDENKRWACAEFNISRVNQVEKHLFIKAMSDCASNISKFLLKITAVNAIITAGAIASIKYTNTPGIHKIGYTVGIGSSLMLAASGIFAGLYYRHVRAFNTPGTLNDTELSRLGACYLYQSADNY